MKNNQSDNAETKKFDTTPDKENESNESIARTPSPILKESEAKRESSLDEKKSIKNRISTPVHKVAVKLSPLSDDICDDDILGQGAAARRGREAEPAEAGGHRLGPGLGEIPGSQGGH